MFKYLCEPLYVLQQRYYSSDKVKRILKSNIKHTRELKQLEQLINQRYGAHIRLNVIE